MSETVSSNDGVVERRRRGMPVPRGGGVASRVAACVLEVLAGVRTPAEAAGELAVSLPRYYQLEQRALQGLVRGCEPPPRGRVASPEGELARLRRDNERLTRVSAAAGAGAAGAAGGRAGEPGAEAGQGGRGRRPEAAAATERARSRGGAASTAPGRGRDRRAGR